MGAFRDMLIESVINVNKLKKGSSVLKIKGDAHMTKLRGVGKVAGSSTEFKKEFFKISKSEEEAILDILKKDLSKITEPIKTSFDDKETFKEIEPAFSTFVFSGFDGVTTGVTIKVERSDNSYYSWGFIEPSDKKEIASKILKVTKEWINDEIILSTQDGEMINVLNSMLKGKVHTQDHIDVLIKFSDKKEDILEYVYLTQSKSFK